MSTQAQATTVRQEIVVEAPVDRAFRVFTEQMDKIKPREHNMLGVDIAETVIEPRAGGRIYDRGTDGSECEWASVIAYEPPYCVVFSWNISPHWQLETDPARRSEVEVRFIADGPERTRVEARTSPPRSPRRRLGGPTRRRRRARRLAALPAALHRSPGMRLS